MADIIQMTTPLLEMEVDVDCTGADEISLTFEQGNRQVLRLDKADLTVTSTKISHKFTQLESGRFYPDIIVKGQLKALIGSDVYANDMKENPILLDVSRILDTREFGGSGDG